MFQVDDKQLTRRLRRPYVDCKGFLNVYTVYSFVCSHVAQQERYYFSSSSLIIYCLKNVQ